MAKLEGAAGSSEGGLGELLAQLRAESKGGQGGPSPQLGPGSDLTFGAATNIDRDSLGSQGLPGAQDLDLEHSGKLGVGARAPEAAPEGESAGAAEGGLGDQRNSVRRRLAPRHRQAVRDFFGKDQ